MSRAIVVTRPGGPEVLSLADVDVPEPGPGMIRLRQTAVGVNFIDVYFRTGRYPAPPAPFPLGGEACGVIEAVGTNVSDLKVGERVAYGSIPFGAYAEARTVPADRVVRVPEGIADESAAAMMLKGLTAEYLLRRTFPVKRGDRVLVHAAAGGVGLLLCQWAKHLGATVIGTVGNDLKAELARENGCTHTIVYTRDGVATRVRELTAGEGVHVAYDSVGKDTFAASLDCLAPRGMLVLFGQSSGDVEPLDPQLLNAKGSLFLTRPSLMHYVARREELVEAASALFAVVKSGAVRVHVGGVYPLAEAARAHADLEARKTTGSLVLVP